MSLLDIARSYVGSGLSVIPVRADGTKKPLTAWKVYQSRLPTVAELERWFGPAAKPCGIAIICGCVSGNLEVLDFEARATYDRWAELVEAEHVPGCLTHYPKVATPAGGVHLYYRLPFPPQGNAKLALDDAGDTSIETRGEGGYVLAPGCPPECHPAGKPYRLMPGPSLASIPCM